MSSKSYIYQFGLGCGFCAEMTWLVTQVIKCMQFDIELYFGRNNISRGVSIQNGWTDFFEEVFPVVDAPFIEYLNRTQFPYNRVFPFGKNIARLWLNIFGSVPADYYMFDTLDDLIEVNLPEFGGKIDFWVASQKVLKTKLWLLNLNTQNSVNLFKEKVELTKPYSAIHIRRGDKISESSYVSLDNYLKLIEEVIPCYSRIFVTSDDSNVISQIPDQLTHKYSIITLPTNFIGGYDQYQFNDLPATRRRSEIERFIAELEIMRDADLFIGTMTSNVGLFIKMLRGNELVYSVDNTTLH